MTDTTARAALIAYAAGTRTVTADGLDPLIDAVIAEAAPPVPADRAGLRERIAAALSEARRPGLGGMTEAEAVAYMADAVLSKLPPDADRAALLREVADECDEAGAAYTARAQNEHAAGAFALMETFLRKANEAEYVATPCDFAACEPGGEPCSTHERLMAHGEGDHELCGPECRTPDGELRRLAAGERDEQQECALCGHRTCMLGKPCGVIATDRGDLPERCGCTGGEEQQAETQAHPAEHTWTAELRDPLAEEWAPGTRYVVRERAVDALAHARRLAPTWTDGTPTERRLVRATTTYTVEPAAAPVARQSPADTTGDEAQS